MLTPKTRSALLSLFAMLLAATSLSGQSKSANSENTGNTCPLPFCLGGKDADSNIFDPKQLAKIVIADAPFPMSMFRGNDIPDLLHRSVRLKVIEVTSFDSKRMMSASFENGSHPRLAAQSTPAGNASAANETLRTQTINLRSVNNTVRLNYAKAPHPDVSDITFNLGEEPEELTLKFSPATSGTHLYLVVVTGWAGKDTMRRPAQTAGLFIVNK